MRSRAASRPPVARRSRSVARRASDRIASASASVLAGTQTSVTSALDQLGSSAVADREDRQPGRLSVQNRLPVTVGIRADEQVGARVRLREHVSVQRTAERGGGAESASKLGLVGSGAGKHQVQPRFSLVG